MKRKALFVGINAYNDSAIADLSFAIADAAALYGQFCALGFTSKLLSDQATTRERVIGAFREFTKDLASGDVFIFYFAGHGFTQVGGGGQLLVARDDSYDLISQGYGGGIPYDYLTRELEQHGCHSVFVLDACRSDILANTRGVGYPTRDLVPKENLVCQQAQGGSMVAMRSCSTRQLSHEVPKLEHGLYTAAMLDVLQEHVDNGQNISFDAALSDAVAVRMAILAAQHGISGRQDPEFVKSGLALPSVWPLNPRNGSPSQTMVRPLPKVEAPNVILAQSVANSSEPKPGDEMTITLPGGVPMAFCWCPATTSEAWKKISGGDDFFWMGSPGSEEGRNYDETMHCVKLAQGFWMGKYEVTQRQWESVMSSNPSCFRGQDRPVENVSWDDCQEFIRRICNVDRIQVSLPAEAQWEYACRAGTTMPFNFGATLNGDRANCNGFDYPYGMADKGKHLEETSPVGSYAPNAWNLYDMHGNVWEWCQDLYGDYAGNVTTGEHRTARGGGWYDSAQSCRSARRDYYRSDRRDRGIGLRLVCSVGPCR